MQIQEHIQTFRVNIIIHTLPLFGLVCVLEEGREWLHGSGTNGTEQLSCTDWSWCCSLEPLRQSASHSYASGQKWWLVVHTPDWHLLTEDFFFIKKVFIWLRHKLVSCVKGKKVNICRITFTNVSVCESGQLKMSKNQRLSSKSLFVCLECEKQQRLRCDPLPLRRSSQALERVRRPGSHPGLRGNALCWAQTVDVGRRIVERRRVVRQTHGS